MAISSRYKDTLDDFIDSSNVKSLPEPIDRRLRNALRSRGDSTGFLKEKYLDEDILASNKLS